MLIMHVSAGQFILVEMVSRQLGPQVIEVGLIQTVGNMRREVRRENSHVEPCWGGPGIHGGVS